MEAYKLKDEIKKQETVEKEELKAMIIDENRIERLLTNRTLKNFGIESKVIGEKEFSLRLLAQFSASFLIIDSVSAKKIMDLIWQDGRKDGDIPVIIYCDEKIKDIYSLQIENHLIDRAIYKKELHVQIKDILAELFNFAPEN